jgi:hypothetical protein
MILQLFIFAVFFIGFGTFAMLKRKKVIGYMFLLLGIMLFAIGSLVVFFYPSTLPF